MAVQKLEQEKPLIVSSSTLPGDFFAEEALVTSCTLRNSDEIKTTALLDIRATGYWFVNPAMTQRICDNLLIKPIRLSKLKAIQDFDGKQTPSVLHAIYPTMTVKEHKEMTTLMLITKLGQHQTILEKPWMKKHDVVLDMRNDWLTFWKRHYQHDVALTLPTAESQAEKLCDEKPCAKEPLPAGEQHTKKSNKKWNAEKPCAKELHASRPMIILKQPINKLLPYLLPSTQGVSKVTSTLERRNTPQKNEPIIIS